MKNFIILNKTLIFFYFLNFFLGFAKEIKILKEEVDATSKIVSDNSTSSYETNQYEDESFFISDFSQGSSSNELSSKNKIIDISTLTENLTERSDPKDEDSSLHFIKPLESDSQMPFGSSINAVIIIPQISPQNLSTFKLLISDLQSSADISIDKILTFIGLEFDFFQLKKTVHEQKILSIIYPTFN